MLFVSVLSLDIVFLSESHSQSHGSQKLWLCAMGVGKKFGSNFGHGKNLATWSSDLRDVCDGGSLSSTVNFTHFLAQQQRHR
jgi:hypothetical protein